MCIRDRFNGADNSGSVSNIAYSSKLKYKSQIESTVAASVKNTALSTSLFNDATVAINLDLDWDTVNKIATEYTAQEGREEGLYDTSYEHDACGVGMLVNIHGGKSHDLVDSALKVLENMRHRGAEGADNKTGDGAGILLQIPHEFILLQGIPVPEKGKYGTGLIFLPKDVKLQDMILSIMIDEIEPVSYTHLRATRPY